MTKKEFLRSFEITIMANPGALTGAEKLDKLSGWDSIAVVEFIAQADDLSICLSTDDIQECRTVDDLWALLENRVLV